VRCTDAAALSLSACTGTTAVDPNIQFGNGRLEQLHRPVPIALSALASRRLVGVVVVTNGNTATIERVRTQLELAFPGSPAETGSDLSAEQNWQVHNIAQLSNVALALTLLIAGCSLAVSVAGALVERKRPFALLRLAGMPLRELHRVVLAEAAAPLLVVAAASVLLGFAVDAILIVAIGSSISFHLPTLGYWIALAGGLALALAIVSATLPLLDRVTSLETARFE
jgi:predicted lysophospholipase L1 biosynthesis ABC-type transport system permease subunit